MIGCLSSVAILSFLTIHPRGVPLVNLFWVDYILGCNHIFHLGLKDFEAQDEGVVAKIMMEAGGDDIVRVGIAIRSESNRFAVPDVGFFCLI